MPSAREDVERGGVMLRMLGDRVGGGTRRRDPEPRGVRELSGVSAHEDDGDTIADPSLPGSPGGKRSERCLGESNAVAPKAAACSRFLEGVVTPGTGNAPDSVLSSDARCR